MTAEKQLKIIELKGAINFAVLSASLASQKVGRLTATGALSEFLDAQAEERKKINEVTDLVDEIAKEAINENN
jgi:hypothetical protein